MDICKHVLSEPHKTVKKIKKMDEQILEARAAARRITSSYGSVRVQGGVGGSNVERYTVAAIALEERRAEEIDKLADQVRVVRELVHKVTPVVGYRVAVVLEAYYINGKIIQEIADFLDSTTRVVKRDLMIGRSKIDEIILRESEI